MAAPGFTLFVILLTNSPMESAKMAWGIPHYFTKGGNNMSEFKTPEGWSTGYHDGYYTKIIKVGNCTAEINRPFLADEERKKREEALVRALAAFGRAVYAQKREKA